MRLYTSHKHALVWLIITGALVAFLTASPMPAVSYLGMAPVILPPVLLFTVALAGILPAFAGLALMLLGAFVVFGADGLWFALYLFPITAAFAVCLEKKVPFFKTAAIVLGVFVFSMAFLFFFLQRASGGALYKAAASAAITGLESLPYRDGFLYTLWKSGFISHGLPSDTQALVSNGLGGWTFSPEVLSEFYKQIDSRLVALLAAYFPSMLTGYSILLSFPILGLAIKMGIRKDTAPTLGMPPFSKWFLPKSANPALLILAAGYLLASFSNQVVLGTAGQLMYNVFSSVILIQGLALLNYFLKRRGTRPGFRLVLMMLLMLILPPAGLMLGVFDQLGDPRKLRQPDKTDETNQSI